jgi:flagellin
MGLSINGPGSSLFALHQIQRATAGLNATQEQLASLLRINRAADDASGLAIADRFSAQVRQLNTEVAGIQNGISLTQTAEGALSAQSDAVGRLRELAAQAANGTLSDDQRAALNSEAQQLLQEIDATAQNTEFNGIAPLDGSSTGVSIDGSGDLDVQFSESTADALGLTGLDLSSQAGANAALGELDIAAASINENRASLGAQENGLQRAADQRSLTAVNLTDSESRIRDLDVAQAFIDRTRNQFLQQAGVAALAQSNLSRDLVSRLLGA